MYTYICNTNSLSLSLSLALSRCHTHANTTHKHHTHTHIHTHAYLALLSGRSPANFRISQLRFAKSRLRFACVSPGYVCGRSPCSFNNKQGREKSNLKRKEIGSDNSLASMFAKQQAVIALNKARDAYNAQLQKGKELGLPVCRSEHT